MPQSTPSIDYRNIVDNSLEGVFQSTPAGRFLMVNPALARLLGYASPQDVLAKVTDIGRQLWVHPDQRHAYAQLLEERGTVLGFETEIRRADGRSVWVAFHTRTLRSPEGAVWGYEGTVQDITLRKHWEEAVRRERDRSQQYLDLVDVMLVGLNARGEITLANRKTCTVLGYEERALLGQPWFERCVPAHSQPEVRELYQQMMARDLPTHERIESAVLTRDGEERRVVWHTTALTDEQGAVTGTLSSGEDVTELRRLEAQHRQAQKMEAVGQLAGGIAHDFNNLLTAMFGYAVLLLERFGEDAEARADLQEIVKAAERAGALTRQLQAFSRKQVLKPEVLTLNDVVADSEDLIRRLIPENIALIVRPAPDLWPVRVDRTQLQQVLMNLAVNARDAIPPEGGRLMIETRNVEVDEVLARQHIPMAPGAYVTLVISDTGRGMGRDTQAHIFEPFFSTKPADQGTGLGLATVYGIVKQSGGFIWVRSELDRGTTFEIYLPCVDDTPARATVARASARPLGGSETILIVEDNEQLRAFATRVLRRFGYHVLSAGNADEAVELFTYHQGQVHLLLTDVVMPGLSGRALAESLASGRPQLRVVYMSGHARDIMERHGLLEADIRLLHKPFTPEALAVAVRDALGE